MKISNDCIASLLLPAGRPLRAALGRLPHSVRLSLVPNQFLPCASSLSLSKLNSVILPVSFAHQYYTGILNSKR